jgi:hypothetical protein
MSTTELIPVQNSSISSRSLRDRLFTTVYAVACAVAMIGWSIALGWAAIRFAGWAVVLIS